MSSSFGPSKDFSTLIFGSDHSSMSKLHVDLLDLNAWPDILADSKSFIPSHCELPLCRVINELRPLRKTLP